jgi:hypothetical protein
MMKVIITFLSLLAVIASNKDVVHMTYVEVNSNSIANAGCFIRSDTGKPFFDIVSIFAANINGKEPNSPELYFNPNVEKYLQGDLSIVRDLQKKGIKVIMTFLGNHFPAGWCCMTDEAAIQRFARKLVEFTIQYQFDGFDIDDEYSTCGGNTNSLAHIIKKVKEDPDFKGKIVTKALFADYFSFQTGELGQYLDYGFEMSYGSASFDSRINTYLGEGITIDRIGLGAWASTSYPSPDQIATYTNSKKLGTLMVYDLTRNSQKYLDEIAKGLYGRHVSVNVEKNCLR